jgi:hypothetical protein
MAQANKKSGFSTVTMILAFIGMGAFLYWLSIASEPTEFAVAEEGPQTRIVTLTEFAQNPSAFGEDEIQLEGVEVQETLGSNLFFFEVPGLGSYLVRLDPALVQSGLLVLPGDRGRLVGTVHMMSDEVLDQWQAQGVFVPGEPGAAQRQAAGAVVTYFLAESVEVTETAEPEAEAQPAAPGAEE